MGHTIEIVNQTRFW